MGPDMSTLTIHGLTVSELSAALLQAGILTAKDAPEITVTAEDGITVTLGSGGESAKAKKSTIAAKGAAQADVQPVRKWRPQRVLPITEKLLLTPREQASYLGFSLRKLYLLEARLPPVIMLGPKHPVRRRADLEEFVRSLQTSDEERPMPAQLAAGKAKRKGAGTPAVGDSKGLLDPGAGSEAQRGAGQIPNPSNPVAAEA